MLKTLDEKNISPEVTKRAEEIANLPGVRQVVVFPDAHLKTKYLNLGYRIDIPSSLAILTENCLYPQFRSRGINCGMTLLKTNLFYEDSVLSKLEKVLLDFNKGLVRNLFDFFRWPLADKFSLSTEKFQQICQKDIEYFDYSGINPKWRQGTRRLKNKMGRHFGGNHFLEIQTVDEIFDQKKAQEWGLQAGQIFILYHTAGEALDDILEKKILDETIYQPHFVKLEKSSPNFPIILKAIKILMNYGFTYRFTTFAILKDLFAEVFGQTAELNHFVDHYHNGIEEIKKDENSTFFLYRHNVNKISEHSPVILSGSFNLKSYVAEGRTEAENFLWSADHGYGDLVKRFASVADPNLKVQRLLFKPPCSRKKEEVPLEHNPAADFLLSLFEKNNISQRIFSLRSIINLKFV